MRVLNEDWSRRAAHRHPYAWVSTAPGELTSATRAAQLADSFPLARYVRRDERRRSGEQGEKRYRNLSRPLVDVDGSVDADVPPLWRDLVVDLTSTAYRAGVAALLDQVPAVAVEVRLVQHARGDWLGPHTDRQDKLFSHILYFNRDWTAAWGGCLEILEGDDADAVAGRVVPALGASALLAQSPRSWHQVTPVDAAAPASRRSLLVHGLR